MKTFISMILGIMSLLASLAVEAGQTVVQGRIATDTVWKASQGPYIIQGKLVIEKGATLTLRPGTGVCFAPLPTDRTGGSGLIIQGGLEAQGSESKPVYFTPLVKGEKWGQLYFQQSASDHSFLKNCVITGGRVVCDGSSPTIEKCFLSGSRNAVVVGPGSHPKIIGNLIVGNRIGLTFLEGAAGSVVSGNAIYDNGFGVFGASRMAGNQIYGNHLSDCLAPFAPPLPLLAKGSPHPRNVQMASAKE